MPEPVQKQIILSSSQNIGIEAQVINVKGVSLAPDNSGTWMIKVDVKCTNPQRSPNSSVSFIEKYIISAEITVLLPEIASLLQISESDVYTTLTLQQTEQAVSQIALSKLLPILNLQF
jgi:hypothetical protein